MMLLVNASPTTLEPYRHPNLGVLCCPRSVYSNNITTWRWAADNDAYSSWDAGRFRDMLQLIKPRTGCLFVTSPDVVGDAKTTGHLYALWRDQLAECGHPVALVAQDGLEHPPWDELDTLFIGGTDRFKMGDTARHLVRQARERGKWVHMGRVNGHRRLRYAKAIGCDSVDGTSLSWFRDTYLRQYLSHASQPPQMMLT